ncbi:MAG: hypothetical protein Q8N33_13060 [Rhodocyclaceae bacterium]|nr:hypothetical protein [Rhodocyclaceae bacterium]
MSQWVDRIRTHRVWPLLESIGPALDSALEREPIGPEQIDSIERLRAILAFCGKRIAAAVPILVFPSVLDGMANALTQLKTHVDAFIANGDVSQLPDANIQADTVLANLASVPGAATADDLTTISAAAASYRSTLEGHLKVAFATQQTFAEKTKANEAKIEAVEASLTTEQQRLATLVTDQQSQFSAAQDKRATEFAATQADYLAKYTVAAAEQQTQFSTDQDARKTAFSEFQRASADKVAELIATTAAQLSKDNKAYSEKLEEFTNNYADNLAELQNGYASKAEAILSDIENYKKKVEDLVGVIGNLGVTSGYQKTANHARWALYFWQAITSVSLVCLIGVAVFTAFPSVAGKYLGTDTKGFVLAAADAQLTKPASTEAKDKASDAGKGDGKGIVPVASEPTSDSDFYHGIATRIFLAITFGIFAGYAGRQASHFMAIERRNRKLALELEALGPFIEPLSEDERRKFRIQVGERSFGVPDHDGAKHKGDDPVTILDLMRSKGLKDFVLDIVKKESAKPS